jgi:hypothetical protein
MPDWKDVIRELLPNWNEMVYERGTSTDIRERGEAVERVEAALKADDPVAALKAIQGEPWSHQGPPSL